jgi:hypothetical protein
MKLLNIIKAPEKLRRILAARKLRRRFAAEDPGKPASDVAIEVLIPVIAKDLPTLSLCVESIRSFVRHPIERIRLIARPDAQMNAIAERLNTPILDENDLLSPEARNLDFRVNGHDRSGWIKQQLLKLAADSVVGTDRFLIVDADTAFARDVVFCRDGRDILFCSGGGRHPPYFRAFVRLTGIKRRYSLSFVAHHMLFNNQRLARLRHAIEQHTGLRWDLAIIGLLDPIIASGFSEYETYGNYCHAMCPKEVTIRYWYNISSPTPQVPTLEQLAKQYGGHCLSVSFHSYLWPASAEQRHHALTI